jgi:hypothetical protein
MVSLPVAIMAVARRGILDFGQAPRGVGDAIQAPAPRRFHDRLRPSAITRRRQKKTPGNYLGGPSS